MATLTRFEDIKAWQEARKLVVDVYALRFSSYLQRAPVRGQKFKTEPETNR